MKKVFSIMLALIIIFSLVPTSVFADSKGASKSTQKMNIDGQSVTSNMEVYNIFNNNYFKLRDIAYLLKDSQSKFSVDWDAASGLIKIETGKAYEAVGGELSERGDLSKKAKKVDQALLIDGEKVSGLTVYNVANNNFFKLRDLADALGFKVDWNAADNAIEINTNESTGLSLKEAYGFSKYASYIQNPKTAEEYFYNFRLAYLNGDYEYNTGAFPASVTWRCKGSGIAQNIAIHAYSDLLGAQLNQSKWEIYLKDGKWFIWTNNATPIFTSAEISKQLSDAYDAAMLIYNKVHQEGLSQKAQAQKYIDYYYSMNIKTEKGGGQTNVAESMRYDTAYAALVNKNTRCGGAAAAISLLMHLEGITCYNEWVDFGNGHIISYMMLDGQGYYCDVHNKFGLFTESTLPKGMKLDNDTMHYVNSLL